MGQMSFFSETDRLESLSRLGDPLERLDRMIPWEEFRPVLARVREKERKSKAGRRPFDLVLMFKTLVLQSLYNISDEQLEFQIRDRLSFMRFLGLRIEDRVPDATTVWRFREALKDLELTEKLFHRFNTYLEHEGYVAKGGQIIDASLVPVPVQRNSREENAQIKCGEVPKDWNKHKRAQKDTEARWRTKNGKHTFGYENHINVDAAHKFVHRYAVTPANVHDSLLFDEVLDPDNHDPQVWADSAYRSAEREEALQAVGYESHIHEKGQAGRPLNAVQQQRNRERSRIRVRVEHVFGHMQNSMGGKLVRTIGLARAQVKIGLRNLTYNLQRFVQLRRGAHVPVAA